MGKGKKEEKKNLRVELNFQLGNTIPYHFTTTFQAFFLLKFLIIFLPPGVPLFRKKFWR